MINDFKAKGQDAASKPHHCANTNVGCKPPYSEKELISKANVTAIRTPSHRLKFYYLDGVLCKADVRVGA